MEAKIHKPVLIVIAGPNGSGKTTITSRVLHHEWLEDSIYINPDNIAQKEQRTTLHLVTTTHIHHRIPNICFPGLFFGNITLSFGEILVFFRDILLSFGDILIFFGDILLSFGVIFVLLISEIVIIRQVEEPIRYLPPQANLVTIRAKNTRLTLFNKKNN